MPSVQRGKYPDNWREIAQNVKDDANWKCVRCDHEHNVPAGYMLTVHHLDGDKSNCRWWNLAALCQRCHLRIQAKVVMERFWMFEHTEWFRPYVAGYYAFHIGADDSRDTVMAQVDELSVFGQGFRTTI